MYRGEWSVEEQFALPPSSVSVQVAQGTDDAHSDNLNGANANLSHTAVVVRRRSTAGGADGQRSGGFRFNNVQIPQGAQITSAHITVHLADSGAVSPDCTIYAEAADNPATFNLTNRRPFLGDLTPTNANVPWSATLSSGFHNTPNLASILQEIVDRPGWTPGNSIVILMITGAGSNLDMAVTSFEGNSANAATLEVAFPEPTEDTEYSDWTDPLAVTTEGVGLVDVRTVGEAGLVASTDIDAVDERLRTSAVAGLDVHLAFEAHTVDLVTAGSAGLQGGASLTPIYVMRTEGVARLRGRLRLILTIDKPRHVNQFTNNDESRVLTFPTGGAGYEWNSRQPVRHGLVETVGADYGMDLDIPHKAPSTEIIRYLIRSNSAANVNQQWDKLRADVYEIGRGRLWAMALTGRRWAEARITAIPEMRLGRSATVMPVVLEFVRLSDWFEEVPVVNDPSSLFGGTVDAVLTNPGTAATYGIFRFIGSFTNPRLQRRVGGQIVEQVIVEVSGNGTLEIDTRNMRVFLNGADISHLASILDTQMGYIVLKQGDNDIRWTVDSGSYEARYTFYPAYH